MDDKIKRNGMTKSATSSPARKRGVAAKSAATRPAPAPKPAAKATRAAVAKAPGRQAAPAKPEATPKAAKQKLVRGSFTLPKDEYATIGDLKRYCQKIGIDVKKGQLLRIAISLLRDLNPERLTQLIASLPAKKNSKAKRAA